LSPRAADADERSPLEGLARTLQVRLSFNAKHYVTRALPARLAVPTVANTPVDNAAWLAVMLIAAGVGVAAAWSRWRAAVLALLVYALLLVLWPYAVSRFLIPMFPAFVAFLLLGAWRIGARLMPRAALVPALGVAAILLVGGTRATASMLGAHNACAPAERDEGELCADAASRYAAAAHQVDAIVAGDAPVFTTKEGTFYYLTRRRVVSVYPAIGLPSDSLAAYLRGRGVPLIFLPHLKNDEEELGDPLAEICASLTDVGSTGDDMLILHVRPPSVGEQNACAAVARWQATW
jgi:hypothetical protein